MEFFLIFGSRFFENKFNRMSQLVNPKISSLFSLVILLVISTFGLSMVTYNESVNLRDFALSDLGCTVTPQGKSNAISCFIFALGMFITSYILLRIAVYFRQDNSIIHYHLKHYLCLMGSVGSFGFIFPWNLNDNIHMIGAGLMVAALWAIGGLLLFEARKFISFGRFLLLQLILQGTVLTYAVTFVVDSPIRNIPQKFAVLGLIFVLKIATASPSTLEFSNIFAFNLKKE